MTTVEPVLQPPLNRTAPWSYIGSVSSVSPVSILESSTTPKSLGQVIYNSTAKSVQDSYNGTGYFIDEEDESMLSDFKTVVLACVATLVPLVLILIVAFGVRLLWIQYKTRKKNMDYDGISYKENATESIAKPLHSHLLTDKSSEETPLSINTEAVEICEQVAKKSSKSRKANGSIITMTLRNNHLTIETEHRDDIEENTKQTTMRYPASGRGGVFIVQVQQGARTIQEPEATSLSEPDRSGSVSDQCALVHNPPEKYSDEETLDECDDSEYYIETTSPERSTPGLSTNSRTGLSTSNTSLGSLHRSYCYSAQECYDHGSYGYNTYHGYVNDDVVKRLPEDTKPKITSAVYKVNPSVKNLKSMSFDLPVTNRDGFKERMGLAQNNSLDNVLESNGLEEFPSNLYKAKPLMQNAAFLQGADCDLDVNTDVKNKNLFKKESITDIKQSDTEDIKESYKK